MAVTELRAGPMARKKKYEDGPATAPIKVDRSIAMKAKAVATDRGIDLAAYLSAILGPVVEKDWLKLVKRADEAERKAKD